MRTIATILSAALLLLLLYNHDVAAQVPSLEQTRAAALDYAGLHKGNADRWSARARLRHLIPKVTVAVGLDDQITDTTRFDEWLTHGPDDLLLWDSAKNQTTRAARNRIDYSVRADIDLRGMLFDPYELAAAREARARHSARIALVEAVHLSYFEWRFERNEPSRDPLRLSELEAELDGLTGGWFTAALRRQP